MGKLDKYNLYRDSIATGDLILWSGRGGFSDLIKNVTNSIFSHASMAIWLRLTTLDEPRLFSIESTTLARDPDAIDNTYRRGIQIHPLGQRIDAYYPGDVYWAPLKIKLTEDQIKEIVEWSLKQHSSKVPYEDTYNLIKAAVDIEKWPWYTRWIGYPLARAFYSKESLKKMFCSEFYLAALRHVCAIDQGINPSEFTPADIVSLNITENPIAIT